MKDNFSTQSAGYARYRPQYPASLFDYINSFVAEKKLLWDCGTGNGQTAAILSKCYDKVFATDISQQQIDKAQKENNIEYKKEPAEKTSLPNSSVDLITVSQALHWFNFDAFYTEVKRVSKPNAIIAVWTYNLLKIDPIIDDLIDKFHFETLDQYWDEERKLVDEGYRSIPFPFSSIPDPGFNIDVNWNMEQLSGYIKTWSAVQKFVAAHQFNPVDQLMNAIEQNWSAGEIKSMRFPLSLKIGYVHQ